MIDLLLGVDIGATGIKAALFQPDGVLRAVAGRRNAPIQDPHGQGGWMVWDPEAIWQHVCSCIRECLGNLDTVARIRAVACTGFGTDGLPLDGHGRPLYPFISWHCARTTPQRDELDRRVGDHHIYQITGYHNYHINTANRFLWFRLHRPHILAQAKHWLQVQDYVAFRLSGEYSTECTIASTTMLLDLKHRTWSPTMLHAAEVDQGILPPMHEAGTPIGVVTEVAARETGLDAGTPVVTGGHDCEVAVLGAGVQDAATWIDITGTWEILIATVKQFEPSKAHYDRGLDFECHALPDEWICQSLLIAGGVTEWVREQFYRDVKDDAVYETMLAEADVASDGVYVLPSFMRGMGPDAAQHALGTLLGLQTATSRGQIVKATLEGLCYQLRRQVQAISEAVGHAPDRLRVVGGGQRNPLWLQLKADITGLPVEVATNPEITLLGAAMLAGVGGGVYGSVDEALGAITFETECVEPDAEKTEEYAERFEDVYLGIAPALKDVYGAVEKEMG